MSALVGVDTNVLAHLIRVVRGAYDPTNDAEACLRAERVAASRIHRALPCLAVPPTVIAELERTAKPEEWAALVGWRS